jgi:hypothetical protein
VNQIVFTQKNIRPFRRHFTPMFRPDSAAPPPRTRFTSAEDAQLRSLVARHGKNAWGAISARMRGRTARACRDRWLNHLCPSLASAEWTPAEDALLLALQGTRGNRWVQIAAFFPNRTDPMVKNRFMALQRHRPGAPRPAPGAGDPPPCAQAKASEGIAAAVDEPPLFLAPGECDSWDLREEWDDVNRF